MVCIKPGDSVLVTTIEKVNMPVSLVGIVRPRSTLYRSGIILSSGQVNPGYSGQLTFGFYNSSPYNFMVQIGARVAHIMFAQIDGKANSYKGQWQGGRISTKEVETQI
jgi:deoxycytidine triphosphate deaminase